MDPYYVFGSTSVALIAGWFAWRYATNKQRAALQERDGRIRELEHSLHIRQRDFLEERNRLEITHSDAIRAAKASAFEEGRGLGNAEREREYVTQLTVQQSEFAARLVLEREQAVAEARERLRAEYELQSKLFTVQISPFVRITEIKAWMSTKQEAETGYQYQLLVNGIPAFQPHIIVERSEVRKEVNEENVRELLGVAKQIAEGAIQMYLGANGQFARLAPAVIKRLKRT